MNEQFEKFLASVDHAMSDINQLFDAAAVNNQLDAMTVFFHGCMLQYGFIPKDVSNEDKFKVMPIDWNARGTFTIKYVHSCCAPFTCCMTCVFLCNNISFHGIICDMECSESVNFNLERMDEYLKITENFSSVSKVFCNVHYISRQFKDYFCLPLLNLMHETLGKDQMLGFRGLCNDVKMYILKLLPVSSVVSMSAVNKNMNELANSHYLWKYLFERDFSKGGIPDVDTASSSTDWKELYRKQYIKKKRKPEGRVFMMPRQRLPQLYHISPEYDDLSIGFDTPYYGSALFNAILPSGLPPHYFRR